MNQPSNVYQILKGLYLEAIAHGRGEEAFGYDDLQIDKDIAEAKQLISDMVGGIIGEDEDLTTPINRHTDGNPESDTDPNLYIVRRATRNIFRTEQRKRKKEAGL